MHAALLMQALLPSPFLPVQKLLTMPALVLPSTKHKFSFSTGALVVAAVVSLALILICVPHRRTVTGVDSTGGLARRAAGSASGDAAHVFLESKGKPQAAELEVAGSKGDKMGRSKAQAAAGLTERDVEDGVAGYPLTIHHSYVRKS